MTETICSLVTHFFFLKMKLKARHEIVKAMPAADRMEKVTVRGIATPTSCSKGTPSYGIRRPEVCGW